MGMSNYGLQRVFEESVSAVTAKPSVDLGTERWQGGKKYVYMYNASTSTALVKLGVTYSGMSGYSMTQSSIAGEGCAGVVYNAQIGPTEYGWVCVRGHVPVTSLGEAATVKGCGLTIGAYGAFAASTGASGIIVGYATGETATAGTFAAFINVG
jgi:hypothetical protein